ncbi:MAG: HAD family hydrolase [Merdibacter sp.]
MSIRLIVTDMDGTLLNYEDHISKENKEALLAYQQNGTKVMLASGRGYLRLKPYIDELHLNEYGGLLIESNGTALYSCQKNERHIFEQMTQQEAIQLFSLLEPFQTEIQFYFDSGVYYYFPQELVTFKEIERKQRNLPDDYPWMGGPWSWVNDTRNGYPDQKQIYSLSEIKQEKINKVNLSHDEQTITRLLKEIKKVLPEHYHMVRTCSRMLEISLKSVSKGNALRYYMKKMNISPDEVIAFGDGENDISMFKEIKYSVAMGNASDFVKRQASAITDTNENSGIAKYLIKFGNS